MTSRKHIKLGDLQLKIMKVLWEQGECTVASVLQDLPGARDLAYTTVATMLRKMEGRGLVSHRTEGRAFLYKARVPAQEVSRSLSDHLVDRVFEGRLTEVVHHLLHTRDVSREELAELERMIAARKRSL